MLSLIELWGIASAVGTVFWPVLEDLVKDVSKDYVKDFLKDCLKSVIPTKPEPLKAATAKALKEFLNGFRVQLEAAGTDEEKLPDYIPGLKAFLRDEQVKSTLGSAFDANQTSVDSTTLAIAWKRLELPKLPDEFNWDRLGRRYLEKVLSLRQEDDKLRHILDSVSLQRIATAAENVATGEVGFDLAKYQQTLLDRFARLKLDSFDTSGAAYTDLKLWSVFVPQQARETSDFIPQLYEVPKEYQARMRERGEWDASELNDPELRRRRQAFFEQTPRNVLDIITDLSLPQLVLLGDPGAGKSTLLQYVALEWARLPVSELPLHDLPLLIELREYARLREAGEVKNFWDFIHAGPGQACHLDRKELDRRLKTGRALILLDGLDEVFDPARRREVMGDIHRCAKDYPLSRIVLTSRIVGYESQPLRSAGFRHFVLQDFTPEQIDDFLDRWHQQTFRTSVDAMPKLERLKRSIATLPALRELAQNPLLLTLMAILNRHEELPRDRSELYRQASRILLHQWDVERALSDGQIQGVALDFRDKHRLLRRLAFRMQATESGLAGNLISAATLEDEFRAGLQELGISQTRAIAKALIQQLRDRNFILCHAGAEFYAFIHRTFLEFFCADEYIFRFKDQQSLTLSELTHQVFALHWREEPWHEVLSLVTGMVESVHATTFINFLLSQEDRKRPGLSAIVAARCFKEMRLSPSDASVEQRLQDALKNIVVFDFPFAYKTYDDDGRLLSKAKTTALNLLAAIWPDRSDIIDLLKKYIGDEKANVQWPAMVALTDNAHDKTSFFQFFIDLVNNSVNDHVRGNAAVILSRGWKGNPIAVGSLRKLVEHPNNALLRAVTAMSLSDGWAGEPTIADLLMSRLREETDVTAHIYMMKALAKGWPSPIVLDRLRTTLCVDENFQRRAGAGEALLQGWKSDPAIVDLIIERAFNDPIGMTRAHLIEYLGEAGIKDSKFRSLLINKAAVDPDSWIRRAAIATLSRHWGQEAEIISLVSKLSRQDEDQFVRVDACEALVTTAASEKEGCRMLVEFIERESEGYARSRAVRLFGRLGRRTPHVIELLKKLAQDESSPEVQTASIETLGVVTTGEREIEPFLQRLALDQTKAVKDEATRQLQRMRYFADIRQS